MGKEVFPGGPSPALETLAELGQLALTASTVQEVLLEAVERIRSVAGAPGAGYLVAHRGDDGRTDPLVQTVGSLGEEECRDAVEEVLRSSDAGTPVSVARKRGGGAAEAVWVFPVGRGRVPSGGLAVIFPSEVSPEDPAVSLVASVAGIVSAGLDLRGGIGPSRSSASGAGILMNSIPDPALVLRRDGTIVEASESAGWMLRRKPEELAGEQLASLVVPEDRERLAEVLAGDSEAGRMETTVAVEVAGGLRRINVHARAVGGGELLALLRDHTRFAARDRGRRILLDYGPRIAAAKDVEDVWNTSWEAVRELLPRAVGLRIYRGDEAAVRLAWASDLPPGTRLVFTVKGWGPKLLAMLQDPKRFEALVERIGGGSPGTRGRMLRFFSGRGNPLLLDDPEAQLRAFLTEEELERIRAVRFGSAPPGQEILCPLVVDGRIDMVAIVVGPPKEHPFGWDDAADVWQLMLLAREVAARQEAEAMVDRHRRLARTYRQTLRGMARATELESLYPAVSGEVLRGTGAGGMVVLFGRRGAEVEWSSKLEPETVGEVRRVVTEMLARVGSRQEPIFVGSTGADEVVGALGARLEGVEAMAVVPAYLGGVHLATLALTWPEPRDFGRDERALVEFLGVGLALALSNHHLGRRLASLRERTQRVADAVDQGLMEVDGAGRIHFINPLAMRLLGITDVEARSRALLGVVTPELRRQLIPVLDQVLRGRDVGPFQLTAGSQKLKVRVVMESGTEGAQEGPTTTWSISEQGEAERRRLRLEKILSISPEMVIDLAPDGTVLGTNPAAARFLEQVGALAGTGKGGGPPAPATWRILGPDDLEELRAGRTVSKAGELVRPGSPPLVWEAEFHAMETSGDMGILAVIHDRTDRKALAKARQSLQWMADSILGFEGHLARINEIVRRGHDLATAVLMRTGAAAGEEEQETGTGCGAQVLAEAAKKVAGEAAADRRVVIELEEQLDAVRRALQDAGGIAGRSVWVITDRPWRSEAVVREIERVGWASHVVPPNDTLSRAGLPQPQVVVLDVGSLTMAVSLYRKVRTIHPDTGILLAVPLGGAGAGGLSEDPRLRLAESVPAGAELQRVLSELSKPTAASSP